MLKIIMVHTHMLTVCVFTLKIKEQIGQGVLANVYKAENQSVKNKFLVLKKVKKKKLIAKVFLFNSIFITFRSNA